MIPGFPNGRFCPRCALMWVIIIFASVWLWRRYGGQIKAAI
jgi:hypothetical protein